MSTEVLFYLLLATLFGVVLLSVKPLGGYIATVMEGELSFRTADNEISRTAGGSFTNITGAHEIRNVGTGAATVLVTVLLPKDREALSYS